VEWSFDNKYFATCSVDNTIKIFETKSKKFFYLGYSVIKELKDHENFVKGVR
jgi:WD40 repeat protein